FAIEQRWPQRFVTLGLVALTAAWMAVTGLLRPDPEGRRAVATGYFAGLLVLIGALVGRSPVFGFFAFTGYLHAVRYLRGWWLMAGVALTSLLTSASQAGGFPALTTPALTFFLVIAVFNLTVAGALTVLGLVTAKQSENRRTTIAQLAEANDKLEAAVAENAGLHAQLLVQAREAGGRDRRPRRA